MIKWKTNPFLRRCLTRGITLIPSFAVAAGIGRAGLDDLVSESSMMSLIHPKGTRVLIRRSAMSPLTSSSQAK